ncbi:MAG: hypothetical protein LUC50_01450, partial [Ruminococcus sp.]|nr:hypothetical protein [Ruminococcus sp.]
MANGTATVYAICGDARAKCNVVVGYDYYLDATDLTVEMDSTATLTLYSSANQEPATGVNVTWALSTEINFSKQHVIIYRSRL